MGNKRISDLPSASTPVAGDKLIINQDGGTKKLDVVDLGNSIVMGTTIRNITDLKAFDDIIDNKTVELLGYHEEGDGGGGTFFWDAASAVADNGGTVIAPTFAGFSGTGRWTRVYSGAVDVKWFGAKGDDNTDDTDAIKSAVKYTRGLTSYSDNPDPHGPQGADLVFPSGVYLISETIQLRSTSRVIGEVGTLIKANASMDVMFRIGSESVSGAVGSGSIRSIQFDGNGDRYTAGFAETGIEITTISSSNHRMLDKVKVQGCNRAGVELRRCQGSSVGDLRIEDNKGVGIIFSGCNNLKAFSVTSRINGDHGAVIQSRNKEVYIGSIDVGTNTFTVSSDMRLENGYVVRISSEGGNVPSSLNVNSLYYVVDVDGNDFKLASTWGGSVVSISDAGSGALKVAENAATSGGIIWTGGVCEYNGGHGLLLNDPDGYGATPSHITGIWLEENTLDGVNVDGNSGHLTGCRISGNGTGSNYGIHLMPGTTSFSAYSNLIQRSLGDVSYACHDTAGVKDESGTDQNNWSGNYKSPDNIHATSTETIITTPQPSVLTNGNFEDVSLSGWGNYPGSAGISQYSDTNIRNSGLRSLRVVASQNAYGVNQTGLSLEPNTSYELSFRYFLRSDLSLDPNTTNWSSAVDYVKGDLVIESNDVYVCKSDHTSSTLFSSDSVEWNSIDNTKSLVSRIKTNTADGYTDEYLDTSIKDEWARGQILFTTGETVDASEIAFRALNGPLVFNLDNVKLRSYELDDVIKFKSNSYMGGEKIWDMSTTADGVDNVKDLYTDLIEKTHNLDNPKNVILNISSLKTADISASTSSVEVLGYHEAGDGGGGTFFWDAASTDADNGGTIIQATGVTTGRWKRVYSGAVNVKWFGVKAVDSDTTTRTNNTAIVNSITTSGFKDIYIPWGSFYFNGTWNIDTVRKIQGAGKQLTVLYNDADVDFLVRTVELSDADIGDLYLQYDGGTWRGFESTAKAINIKSGGRNTLHDIQIMDYHTGIYYDDLYWLLAIDRCTVWNASTGYHLNSAAGGPTTTTFTKCWAKACINGYNIQKCSSVSLIGCAYDTAISYPEHDDVPVGFPIHTDICGTVSIYDFEFEAYGDTIWTQSTPALMFFAGHGSLATKVLVDGFTIKNLTVDLSNTEPLYIVRLYASDSGGSYTFNRIQAASCDANGTSYLKTNFIQNTSGVTTSVRWQDNRLSPFSGETTTHQSGIVRHIDLDHSKNRPILLATGTDSVASGGTIDSGVSGDVFIGTTVQFTPARTSGDYPQVITNNRDIFNGAGSNITIKVHHSNISDGSNNYGSHNVHWALYGHQKVKNS